MTADTSTTCSDFHQTEHDSNLILPTDVSYCTCLARRTFSYTSLTMRTEPTETRGDMSRYVIDRGYIPHGSPHKTKLTRDKHKKKTKKVDKTSKMLNKTYGVAITFLLFLLSRPSSAERPGTEDKMIYAGRWGGWKPWGGDDTGGFYVCGAQLKFEDSQGSDGDDTAANGLKLRYCFLDNWHNRREDVVIHHGNWGTWKDEMKMCGFNQYVDGAQVRFEDPLGSDGDDTALNGLKIHCRHKDTSSVGKWITVYGGNWGKWKNQVVVPNKFVKLARVRYEDSHDGDDTALNGIQFRYETPNAGISDMAVLGDWAHTHTGTEFTHTVTEQVVTTERQFASTAQSSSFGTKVDSWFFFTTGVLSGTVNAKVEGKYSHNTYKSIESTLQLTQGSSFSVPCKGPSPTGYWVLWQWKMNSEPDRTGPGISVSSKHTHCTPSRSLKPKCPLGHCADKWCQECTTWTTTMPCLKEFGQGCAKKWGKCCGSTPYCWRDLNTCVGCLGNSDCPSGEECFWGKCDKCLTNGQSCGTLGTALGPYCCDGLSCKSGKCSKDLQDLHLQQTGPVHRPGITGPVYRPATNSTRPPGNLRG